MNLLYARQTVLILIFCGVSIFFTYSKPVKSMDAGPGSKTTDCLMDMDEYLYYRDSRFFAKKENNGTKVFWSRGNGLVRVLSVMPDNHPDKPRFVKLLQNMSAKIAKIQQPDGTWHASLLDPESYPVKEIQPGSNKLFTISNI